MAHLHLLLTLITLGSTSIQAQACQKKPVDIGLIIDAGILSHPNYWPQITRYISDIISETFSIGPNETRIAAMTYGITPQINFGFEAFNSAEEIKSALDLQAPRSAKISKLDLALDLARNSMFKDHKRPGASQVAIIITEWAKIFNMHDAKAAEHLRHAGVDILMGVVCARYISFEGKWHMENHLKNFQHFKSQVHPIVSSPYEEHLFIVDPGKKQETSSMLVQTTCQGRGAAIDIGFILDVAHFRDFDRLKAVLKDIIDHFHIGPQRTRVAMLIYSSVSQIIFHFEDNDAAEKIKEAVDHLHEIPPRGMYSSTENWALEVALNDMFLGHMRADAAPVAIYFTMLNFKGKNKAIEKAALLKAAGVTVLAATWSPDLSDMAQIASEPAEEHMFELRTFLNYTSVSDKFIDTVRQAPVRP